MWRWAILAAFVIAAACDPRTLPPYGEVLLVVDTDAPVPTLASRFRLDVYSPDGKTWQSSREIARVDPRDWPVSLSLFDPDLGTPRSALVRVRVYPAGKVRDYRGERYASRPEGALWAKPDDVALPVDQGPRLFDADGRDVTPAFEPLPSLAIDRLLHVDFEPGKRGSVRIVMRGACFSTMANLAELQTCTDTENTLAPVVPEMLDPDMMRRDPSLVGTFGAAIPCTAPTRSPREGFFDDDACIDGGAFVFGNADVASIDDPTGVFLAGIPERVAVLSPFRIDRYEVTVARFRDALDHGFKPPDPSPVRNDGPLDRSAPITAMTPHCAFSTSPLGREDYPVNCLSVETARAFCQFDGGDLATEAQWEYAAQVFGRPSKTPLPWGDKDPQCDTVVYGRASSNVFGDNRCAKQFPQGIVPVNTDEATDISRGANLVGMGGNVSEMTLGSPLAMDTICWLRAPLHDPICDDPDSPGSSIRGGDWAANSIGVLSGVRMSTPASTSDVVLGFRCARRGTP